MKTLVKLMLITFVSLFAAVGAVLAAPITVQSLSVQEANGEYVVITTLQNTATGSEFTELSFAVEELGTMKNMGPVKVDNNETQVFVYSLRDVTDSFELLRRGDVYTLTATTGDDEVGRTQSFLFGNLDSTDGLDLLIEEMRVNGVTVTNADTLQVLNGEQLDVTVRFVAQNNFDDARLRMFIEGYEHDSLMTSSEIFSVREGTTYVKTLSLTLPDDMRSDRDYKLRLTGANDLSGLTYKELDLFVDTQRHRLDVVDFITTPATGIQPGQNLIGQVRVKNMGQRSQDTTKVTVSIPDLGVEGSSFVSNLGRNEVVTSDDMLLYIPRSAEAGTYEVLVRLEYSNGHVSSYSTYTLNVLAPTQVPVERLLASFNDNIDLVAGEEKSFDIVIANPGTTARPVSVTPTAGNWADVTVSPSLSMISGGSDATFTVTVTPRDEISGERALTLAVKEGSEVVSEVSVSTYVEEAQGYNWTNIILAILLVVAILILIALIVAIARRRNDDEGNPESTEEYY